MDRYFAIKIWAGLLLLLLTGLVNCSEKNENAPYDNTVHAPAWANLNLMGTDAFHGFEVKLEGIWGCAKCHDIDDSEMGTLPGCYGCHFGPDGSRAPVSSGWVHGRDGHENYSDNKEVCNTCHELARGFEAGPGICHNCHGSGEEHILGRPWLDRVSLQFHGDQPQDDCSLCHNLSTSCNECHFGSTGQKSPQGSGWQHGTIDNHNDLEDDAGVCNRCHSLSRSYRGEPDSSCHDCHHD